MTRIPMTNRTAAGALPIGLLLMTLLLASGCGSDQETLVLPAGTSFAVSLNRTLTTQKTEGTSDFTATIIEPVQVDGQTVIPAGATVYGTVTESVEPGRLEGRARMTLEFRKVEGVSGETHSLNAIPLTVEAGSGTRDDLEKIAAGAVAGAIIGGLAEGGKGAAIGAAIGAGAGGVVVVATRGDHLTLQPGQHIIVHTDGPMQMPVYAKSND